MNSITINTTNASTNEKHLLVYELKQPMNITGFVKLSNAWMYYSWRNVTSKIGNNHVKITREGVTTDITLPDGSYDVEDFSKAIINAYNFKTGYKITYNLFTPNPVYNRVTLKVGADISLEINNKVAYMLGQSKTLEAKNVVHTFTYIEKNFPYVPKIENVNSVHVNCNLVLNEYQHESRLLYSFTPSVKFSSLITLEPRSLWKKTRNATESEILIWLTDDKGYVLDIDDEMSFTITIADEEFIRG